MPCKSATVPAAVSSFLLDGGNNIWATSHLVMVETHLGRRQNRNKSEDLPLQKLSIVQSAGYGLNSKGNLSVSFFSQVTIAHFAWSIIC